MYSKECPFFTCCGRVSYSSSSVATGLSFLCVRVCACVRLIAFSQRASSLLWAILCGNWPQHEKEQNTDVHVAQAWSWHREMFLLVVVMDS